MPGYNQPRIVDFENDCLRARLADIKAGAQALVRAVELYTEPKTGEFMNRSDLLRIKDCLKNLLK